MLDTARGPVRCARMLQLAQEGGTEARLVDAAEADVTVEVAVGALLGAERPVHVDAEPASSARSRQLGASRHGPLEVVEGAGSVRDGIFAGRLHFAERLLVAVGDEDRIIAETVAAARRPNDMTVNFALEQLGLPVRPGKAQHRDEVGAQRLAASRPAGRPARRGRAAWRWRNRASAPPSRPYRRPAPRPARRSRCRCRRPAPAARSPWRQTAPSAWRCLRMSSRSPPAR